MKALWRLEKGGVQFELAPEGKITYINTWPGELPVEWANPLLAEIRANQAELVAILKRRQEWERIYDEWCEVLAKYGDDPQRDAIYLERLKEAAIAGQMPCYDGTDIDQGPAGWQRVTARQIKDLDIKEIDEMGIKIEQTTYDAVPTGDYKAVITSIEQVEGKFGPQLQIKSEINDGPYVGNTFLCWVSPKFSPKSRLFEWVEAAMGRSVPRTYTFDSDHLIGREIIATLVVRELDGGGEVNRVDRVRAVAKETERLPFGE